jgi:sulfonate transport system substrate-binding protein
MLTRRQTLIALGGTAAELTVASMARASAAPAKVFRIGWQKSGVLALVKKTGALEKRFATRGLSIEWSEFSSGPPLLEALGAGALDFGPTGDVPPLFAQAAGGNLLYVGTYKGAAASSAILVHKDAAINTLSDLKGKKIAFKRGSSAHNFAVKALRKGGLSLDDVEQVNLAPPDAKAAFTTGSIDAWVIWDPYLAVAETDPTAKVLTTAEGIVDAWSYYLANGDFTAANPDIISAAIDELGKQGVWAQAHLDQTIPVLADITGVPADVTHTVLTRPGADLGKIDPMSDQAVAYQQALADEFQGLGILPKKLTISDIVWHPKAS